MKINKRILLCEYAEIVPASYMPDAETQERLNPGIELHTKYISTSPDMLRWKALLFEDA